MTLLGSGTRARDWLRKVADRTAGTSRVRALVRLERDPARVASSLAELGLLAGVQSVAEALDQYVVGDAFAVAADVPSGRAVGAVRARAVGAVRALPVDDGLLLGIAIRRRYRGHGLGRRLLAEAIAEARRRGVERLVADVRRDNVASLRLFRGAGFEKVADEVLVSPADGVRFDRYALGL